MPQYHRGLVTLVEEAQTALISSREALERNDAHLNQLRATNATVAALQTNQIAARNFQNMAQDALRIIRAEMAHANGAKE